MIPSSFHPTRNGEGAMAEGVGCVERKRVVRADGAKMARGGGRNKMPRQLGNSAGPQR